MIVFNRSFWVLVLLVLFSGVAIAGSLKVKGASRNAAELQGRWHSSGRPAESSASGSDGIAKLRKVAIPIQTRAGVINFLREVDCHYLEGHRRDICLDVERHLTNRTHSMDAVGKFTSPYCDGDCNWFLSDSRGLAGCRSIMPYAGDKGFMLLWSTLGAMGYIIDLNSEMVYE